MNALSTIAAAVTAAIAGATLPGGLTVAGGGFTVARCYVPPDYETAATRELRVLVIGFEEDVDLFGENATRDEADHLYGVKVAIVKRLDAGDVTAAAALPELDALSDVREGLLDFLKSDPQREQGGARLAGVKNAPAVFDPATLDQKRVFVSVIETKYRLLR